MSQPRAKRPVKERVNPLKVARKSDAERTIMATITSKYKQIHGEVKRMIEQMIHPSDKARQPLRLNTIKTVE